MKKTLAMVLAMGMTIASLTACGGSKPAETTAAATEAASSAADTKAETTEPAGGKAEGPITVVSVRMVPAPEALSSSCSVSRPRTTLARK